MRICILTNEFKQQITQYHDLNSAILYAMLLIKTETKAVSSFVVILMNLIRRAQLNRSVNSLARVIVSRSD